MMLHENRLCQLEFVVKEGVLVALLVGIQLALCSSVTNPRCVSVIQYAMTCGEGSAGSSRVEALRLTSAAAVLLAAYLRDDVVSLERLFNCRSM